ncbi:hypothetical protein ACROYT_G023631 [Oculina patagonica]
MRALKTKMKLVVLFVAMMLLCSFEPITAQRKRIKVLRMCKGKFSSCSSSRRYSRNFKAGSKCCGRAWTVCQIHRNSCLKVCYPSYRKCMCGMGFSYYC